MSIGMHNVEKFNNVRVRHFLQKGNFANGGGRDTLIFGFETNLLQCNDAVIVLEILGLVNNPVGS